MNRQAGESIKGRDEARRVSGQIFAVGALRMLCMQALVVGSILHGSDVAVAVREQLTGVTNAVVNLR